MTTSTRFVRQAILLPTFSDSRAGITLRHRAPSLPQTSPYRYDEALALEVVELLLAHGADPAVKGDDQTTAADSARALGQERVAERLERAARA
ncbi:MAG: hypothetical protein ACRD3G_06860 [Vicinamibacterales bacterium]